MGHTPFTQSSALVCSSISKYSMIMESGEVWTRHRKLATPVFTPTHLKNVYFDLIKDVTRRLLASLRSHSTTNDGTPSLEVNLHQMTASATADVIGLVAFSMEMGLVDEFMKPDFQTDTTNMYHSMRTLLVGLENRIGTPAFMYPFLKDQKGFLAARGRVRDFVTKVVSDKRKVIAREKLQNSETRRMDVADLFLNAMEDPTYPISEEEVIDECQALFVAGHEVDPMKPLTHLCRPRLEHWPSCSTNFHKTRESKRSCMQRSKPSLVRPVT